MNLKSITENGVAFDYPLFAKEVLAPVHQEQAQLEQCIHSVIGYRDLADMSQIKRGLLVRNFQVPRNEQTFKDLIGIHPVYADLYRYKKNEKFLKIYGAKMEAFFDDDGRIHPEYRIASETTGRITAYKPAATAFDGRFMRYIIPAKGNALLHLDYKAMEFRVLAAICKDKELKKRLSDRHFDIHRGNASLILHKPESEVTDADRQMIKSIGFALIYGAGAGTVSAKLNEKAGNTVTPADVEKYMARFFLTYKGVWAYYHRMAHTKSSCYTLKGVELRGNLRYSQRLNYPIQATAADAFKEVITAIEDHFPEYKICLPVHDALYIEVPEPEAETALVSIQELMEIEMTNYLGVCSFTDTEIIYRK